MAKIQDQAGFSCELRIIRARNVEFDSMGSLFVRCYMSAGNKKRVRFQSREVSSSNMAWNQSFSLDCFGTEESMSNMLVEGTAIFELRWRSGISFFGRRVKSQLLGKAEVPWKTVCESSTMDIEKWIVMNPKKNLRDGVKPAGVQIGMKVTEPQPSALKHTKNGGAKGCKRGCKSCFVEREIFALEAALEFSCY